MSRRLRWKALYSFPFKFSVVEAPMGGGLVLLLCLIVFALYDACIELQSVLDLIIFGLLLLPSFVCVTSPNMLNRIVSEYLRRFGGVFGFSLFLRTYYIELLPLYLVLTDNKKKNVLWTHVMVSVCFSLSAVCFVVVEYVVLFQGFVEVCSTKHETYTDGVLNSVLQDADNL